MTVEPSPATSCRTTDPLAMRLFELLRDATPGDRDEVLGALRRESMTHGSPREQLAIEALQRWSEEDCARSKHAYESWRQNHAESASLPSATLVINACGGTWNRAMSAAGLGSAIVHGDRRLTALGARPTDDQLLDGLARCAVDLGRTTITFVVYREWAIERMKRELEPRPLTITRGSFLSRFGSWDVSLAKAGLTPTREMDLVHNCSCSSEHLLWCLRQAAAESQCSPLTTFAYGTWRQTAPHAPEGPDQTTRRPNSTVFGRRFGSWPSALVAAGLMSAAVAEHYARGPGKRFSVEHIAACLVRCESETGERVMAKRYDTWRVSVLANPSEPRIPVAAVIRRRFGTLRAIAPHVTSAVRSGDVESLEAFLRSVDSYEEID